MTFWRVIEADCVKAMAAMGEASVDAVVCDPPYHLAFMGRAWDRAPSPAESQAQHRRWADECLRVLKPGGHLLAFGGTRTYHRLTCAVEDAGFEIRDTICWLYGSGFPKSLDVSKAIDAAAPRVGLFDAFAAHFRERREASGLTQRAIAVHFPSKTGGLTGCVWNWENGANVPTREQWGILQPILGLSEEWLPLIDRVEAERAKVGEQTKARSTDGASALPTMGAEVEYRTWDVTAPATPDAERWQGWGTALKPAHEPIVVARKPLAGTVAANVLEHGTGALNVDGCRIGRDDPDDVSGWSQTGSKASENRAMSGPNYGRDPKPDNDAGRWPANVVLDEQAAAMLDEQTGERRSAGEYVKGSCGGPNDFQGPASINIDGVTAAQYDDSGGASRFFANFEHQEDPWTRDSASTADNPSGPSDESLGSADGPAQDVRPHGQEGSNPPPSESASGADAASATTPGTDQGDTAQTPAGQPPSAPSDPSARFADDGSGSCATASARSDAATSESSAPSPGSTPGPPSGPQRNAPTPSPSGASTAGDPASTDTTSSTTIPRSSCGSALGAMPLDTLGAGEANEYDLTRFRYQSKSSSAERNAGLDGFEASGHTDDGYGSIQTPKLDRSAPRENWTPREVRNVHPTVKPIALMRWLVRLVTAPGGTVLDPFAGSGTTGCAAVLEGFDFIGIEREAEYAAIAKARIAWWAEHPEGVELADRLDAEQTRRAVADAGQLQMFGKVA